MNKISIGVIAGFLALVAITPSAAPMRIPRLAAFCGMFMSHSAAWGRTGWIALPIGTRPSIRMNAATASRSASNVRTRNARNAADAMKNASSENIVADMAE